MKANLTNNTLEAFGKLIPISCKVRNELNNRRKNEVVRSIPDNKPIQPRVFPAGKWDVKKPLPRDTDYLRPFFIPTNAWQNLPIWSLDEKGNYKEPTATTTKDMGYGLHYSTSNTTVGCIKIIRLDDLLWLVDRINDELNECKSVTLEVIN